MRLPRLLAQLLAPAVNIVLPLVPMEDPWRRMSLVVPPPVFGQGSVREFRWYFEGESRVTVNSVDAICEWLAGCTYVSDPELFNEADFWQHPRTFEQLRQGDCEDHALWAWRKLVELGYDAELLAGRWDLTRPNPAGHAWVLFRDRDGRELILEGTGSNPAIMVRPLDDVRARYRPHAAVNAKFRTTAFAGYLITRREQRAAKRRRGADPVDAVRAS